MHLRSVLFAIATLGVATRAELMKAAWRRVTEELIYVPMYHQVLVWAMRRNVEAPLRPDNWLEIRWVKVN